MAIRIEERFAVRAPPPAVWSFLVDPRQVVTCLPGAELSAVVDETTFDGDVRVKLGAMTLVYRGRVRLVEVDAAARRVRMTGEGREAAGAGQARMSLVSQVTESPGGAEVVVQADVDVVGRVVQLGRGMIENVAHQLFQDFARRVRARLEATEAGTAGGPGGDAAASAGGATARASVAAAPGTALAPPESVPLLPLLLKALWAWLGQLLGVRRGPTRP